MKTRVRYSCHCWFGRDERFNDTRVQLGLGETSHSHRQLVGGEIGPDTVRAVGQYPSKSQRCTLAKLTVPLSGAYSATLMAWI